MGVRLLVVLALALGLSGCGESEGSATQSSLGEVVELTRLSTLKTAFAEGDGKPRLLLLLSPT